MRFSVANAEGILTHLDSVGALPAKELKDPAHKTMHRKRLTIDIFSVAANILETLAQDCAVLPGQLWRRFALFSGGAFGFADGDHEFGLLPR